MEILLAVLALAALWLLSRKRSGARWQPQGPRWAGFPSEFVVFDLETTRLDSTRHRIIEIGAILVKREQIGQAQATLATFQSLVRIPGKVPRQIVELTGITTDMLASQGIELEEALQGFLDFAGHRHLIAYNAPFDTRFINAALAERGPLQNEVSCALQLTRTAFPGRPSYKLAVIAASVDAGPSHRTLADCHRTLVAYVSAGQRLGN